MMSIAVTIQEPKIEQAQTPRFVKSKLRLFMFSICLLTVGYMTAASYKDGTWNFPSLVMVFGLLGLGFLSAGISIHTCVFATIAFLPNLNSFLPMGSFSLTWVEAFMALSSLFLLQKPVRLTKMGLLSICLFLACAISLIGSPLGLLAAGLMFRFGILLLFINLLILQREDPLIFKSFFLGLLLIPFMACASYAGEGVLTDIFSANFLAFSRALYSFQYPIWFAVVIPFLIYNKTPRLLTAIASLFVVAMIVLSFARSVILGTGVATALFLFYYKDRKPVFRMLTKTAITLLIVAVLFLVIVVLKFLEFQNMENGSNVTRYTKIPMAFNQFKRNPLFGAGFGASNDRAIAEKRSAAEVFEELISAEFGPVTALAEIGAVGAFFLFYIMCLSLRDTIRILKDPDIKFAYKLVVLIACGGFVSSFLNSNSLSSIIVYLFLGIPVFFNKNKGFIKV